MKIAIAGGKEEADFLIGSLLSKKVKLKIINEDKTYCEYLSQKYNIQVLNGDQSKEYILEDADIVGYDVLIALSNNDADNFVTCQVAKKKLKIKKVVCTVTNPTNVEIFKKLGINNVISSAYSVARLIEQATTIENLVSTLSSEDESFSVSELIIKEDTYCVNKKIQDIKLPEQSRIVCVIHNGKMVIPIGKTIIHAEDRVLILSAKECYDKAIEVISGGTLNERKQDK